MKEITQVDRIKHFGLTCTLSNNGVERHFLNGHEYVEIGGIKWATCNVGAEKVIDYGKYFAWGETKGFFSASEKRFTLENYEFGYNASKYNRINDKAVLDISDDAVAAVWGNGWRLPTKDEYVALGNAVTTAWTDDYQGSGVAGLVCTDKTDSSKVLFFPACGCCYDGNVFNVGDYGYYWSSSLDSSNVKNTYDLYFSFDFVSWQSYTIRRYYGFPVRGVVG